MEDQRNLFYLLSAQITIQKSSLIRLHCSIESTLTGHWSRNCSLGGQGILNDWSRVSVKHISLNLQSGVVDSLAQYRTSITSEKLNKSSILRMPLRVHVSSPLFPSSSLSSSSSSSSSSCPISSYPYSPSSVYLARPHTSFKGSRFVGSGITGDVGCEVAGEQIIPYCLFLSPNGGCGFA